MNVLIIGGTKFLGYFITRKLLSENINVTLFNRGISPDDFGDSVQRIRGDRQKYKKFYDTFRDKRFDAVIDLIGYELNDIEVIEKTFRDHIGQYIFISSGQVYLITENKHQPAREENYYQKVIPCPPGEEAAYNYGLGKRRIEDFLEKKFRTAKFPSVRFRCPIIQGPRDYTLRLYSYLLRLNDAQGLIIPEEQNPIIRHIYVADVAEAVFSALQIDATRGKVFNVAQQETLHLTEFIEKCAAIMDVTAIIRKIPLKTINGQNIRLDISPFSSRWVSYLDPAYAIEEIGFNSTPINKWLTTTIDYFLNEYEGEKPENYNYRPLEAALVSNWNSK